MPEYLTWPMEPDVSPAALHYIALAIDDYLTRVNLVDKVVVEMQNTANDIRSLLQHYVADRKAPKPEPAPDEGWLDI